MQSDEKNQPGSRRRKQRGSEMVEFTLVLLPFFGFMFLILNIAWAVYTRATVQFAVAQGVRYAITSQTMPGMGLRASVQTVVQQNAFGRLGATAGTATGVDGWNNIYVDYYAPTDAGTLTPLDGETGATWTADAKNLPLVQVSVQGLTGKTLLPFVKMPGMGSLTSITTTAVAWDRMEAPPLSGTPAM
jgi:Flp pilus assembly protein TadG